MKILFYTSIILLALSTCLNIQAQDAGIHIEPSVDTAYVGEIITVQFVMSNIAGELSKPFWHDSFEVDGSIGSFSQTSITNNEVASKTGYTYTIRPTSAGVFPIEGQCTAKDGTEFNDVYYLTVKEGVRENETNEVPFRRLSPYENRKPAPSKKKRKIYRL